MNKRLKDAILDDLCFVDTERAYDDMLDECYSFKSVGGPFEFMSPSQVLRVCDPTAYRCGFSDWLDSQGDRWIEVEGSFYDRRQVSDMRDEIVYEVEKEIAELEKELEAAEADKEEADKHLTDVKGKVLDAVDLDAPLSREAKFTMQDLQHAIDDAVAHIAEVESEIAALNTELESLNKEEI